MQEQKHITQRHCYNSLFPSMLLEALIRLVLLNDLFFLTMWLQYNLFVMLIVKWLNVLTNNDT